MTEIIGVRFKSGGKQYFFDPRGMKIEAGQGIIIETSRGMEYVQCVKENTMVEDEAIVPPLRPVVRVATADDQKTLRQNQEKERHAFQVCQEKIERHKLDMKLVEVEYNFDGSKILFFFTSEGRVDFRALVKDLVSVFHTRIELRQIGVRDEAKMLGGLGICGKPFCCATFLNEFQPVSIKMAKTQNLSLNPTKISGTCGRLMCCLKYEQDAYEDAVRRCPKQESFVETPDGVGTVTNVNLLREQVKVRLDGEPEAPKSYHNCEICVVRNGKGKRPEDYVPPTREELEKRRWVDPDKQAAAAEKKDGEWTPLSQALERVLQGAEEGAEPVREKKTQGDRSRNRNRRKKPEAAAAQDARPNEQKKPPAQKKQGEQRHRNDKPRQQQGQPKQERPVQQAANPEGAGAEKKPGRSRRRHHRGGQKPNGGQGKPPAVQ